jgi:putative oxidoreductase
MKVAVLIARILLGFMFVFFGLNGLYPFLPMPAPPPGLVGQFMGVFFASHWVYVIAVLQVISGLLILLNRYTVLGLTILGPIIFNILTFHILMDPKGIGGGVLAAILWCFLAWRYRQYFASLFVQRPQ